MSEIATIALFHSRVYREQAIESSHERTKHLDVWRLSDKRVALFDLSGKKKGDAKRLWRRHEVQESLEPARNDTPDRAKADTRTKVTVATVTIAPISLPLSGTAHCWFTS